ncbi:LysR family transcriptional regulator [Pseudomonas sp. CrR25]|nr:LysR family transcriptional regulator [Pseudomonas sp. CrR25]
MRQDHLDGLVTFVQVAEHRSFTHAAQRLGVSTSAVSQVVRSLEGRLGVVLLKRTTRSVKLTEPGERFLKRVKPLVVELAHAADEIADQACEPAGQLRLVASTAAYLTVLRPHLRSFLQCYPAIDIDIVLRESRVDLVSEGFDAGIGLDWQVERDLVAVSVGAEQRMVALASPLYLANRGVPGHPNELSSHDCIGYRHPVSGAVERWVFENGQESVQISIKSRLNHSDPVALLHSAVDGLGIAYLPNGHTDDLLEQGKLLRVLDGWGRAISPYMLYFPDRRSISSRLRLLIDHLRGQSTGC